MVAFEVEEGAPISGFLVQGEHSAASRDGLYAGTGDQMQSGFSLLKNVQRRGRTGETELELGNSSLTGKRGVRSSGPLRHSTLHQERHRRLGLAMGLRPLGQWTAQRKPRWTACI